jgi:hypothetical protein
LLGVVSGGEAMKGISPYDPASNIRALRETKEDLADYIRRHEEEFDGFDPMEEDWIISVWPELKRDLEG